MHWIAGSAFSRPACSEQWGQRESALIPLRNLLSARPSGPFRRRGQSSYSKLDNKLLLSQLLVVSAGIVALHPGGDRRPVEQPESPTPWIYASAAAYGCAEGGVACVGPRHVLDSVGRGHGRGISAGAKVPMGGGRHRAEAPVRRCPGAKIINTYGK